MKKLVVVLSMLCLTSFIAISKLESTFAISKAPTSNLTNSIDSDIPSTIETIISDKNVNSDYEANTILAEPLVENNIDTDRDDNINQIAPNDNIVSSSINSDTINTTETTPEVVVIENNLNNDITTGTDIIENTTVVNTVLDKNEALNLLKEMNPNLTYEYQGDENSFNSLKDKGLSGYVFLPNIETDLGYFVDKNTSHIYYFHPSGYLELIK